MQHAGTDYKHYNILTEILEGNVPYGDMGRAEYNIKMDIIQTELRGRGCIELTPHTLLTGSYFHGNGRSIATKNE